MRPVTTTSTASCSSPDTGSTSDTHTDSISTTPPPDPPLKRSENGTNATKLHENKAKGKKKQTNQKTYTFSEASIQRQLGFDVPIRGPLSRTRLHNIKRCLEYRRRQGSAYVPSTSTSTSPLSSYAAPTEAKRCDGKWTRAEQKGMRSNKPSIKENGKKNGKQGEPGMPSSTCTSHDGLPLHSSSSSSSSPPNTTVAGHESDDTHPPSTFYPHHLLPHTSSSSDVNGYTYPYLFPYDYNYTETYNQTMNNDTLTPRHSTDFYTRYMNVLKQSEEAWWWYCYFSTNAAGGAGSASTVVGDGGKVGGTSSFFGKDEESGGEGDGRMEMSASTSTATATSGSKITPESSSDGCSSDANEDGDKAEGEESGGLRMEGSGREGGDGGGRDEWECGFCGGECFWR
ncbi:hypothetical protein DM02DRAFT_660698 [Periconia macrospinosa]|uniref:Uncharacterized protein n=1 Tax=Periconia macrospinosa TaxID=97972 RepID=A0A2V1DC79_9PLEO|nr:hypothetical protein DM02DRAFT_660698 [Periconia macrospinosa]